MSPMMFVTLSTHDINHRPAASTFLYVAQNRRKPILPFLVFRAFL